MICASCTNEVLLSVENYILIRYPKDYKLLEKIYNTCFKISKEDIICKNCGSKIYTGESYLDDYCENKAIKMLYEYIAKEINKKIVACEECSDPTQIFIDIRRHFNEEDDDPDGIIENLNTSQSVEELIFDNFKLDSNDDITQYLYCSGCKNGTGIDWDEHTDYGEFDKYTEVYTQEDLDEFDKKFNEEFDEIIRELNAEVKTLAGELTLEELKALIKSYLENKDDIHHHPVFIKLENLIKNLYYNNNKVYILSKNRVIFRARAMNSTEGKGLEDKALWEPPYGVSPHGRYNAIGRSVLYCANNINILKKEVQLGQDQKYYFTKFIIKKPLHLFPINNIFKDKEFNGLIEASVNNNDSSFKEEYTLCNIVSAICLKVGYNGIAYRSTKDHFSINYALFNFKKCEDLKKTPTFT